MRRDTLCGEVEADFALNYDWEKCGRCLEKHCRLCSMDSWFVIMIPYKHDLRSKALMNLETRRCIHTRACEPQASLMHFRGYKNQREIFMMKSFESRHRIKSTSTAHVSEFPPCIRFIIGD